MIKETYERLLMDVTKFDAEDIITTSGFGPGGGGSGGSGGGGGDDHLPPYELPIVPLGL